MFLGSLDDAESATSPGIRRIITYEEISGPKNRQFFIDFSSKG